MKHTVRVQFGLKGYVKTGEYRKPVHGEFWASGDEVWSGSVDSIGARHIVVPDNMHLPAPQPAGWPEEWQHTYET